MAQASGLKTFLGNRLRGRSQMKRLQKKRLGIGLGSVAVIAAASAAGVVLTGSAATPQSAPPTVYPCPPPGPPGLPASNCTPASQAAAQAASQAQSARQWPVTGTSYLSEEQAIAEARTMIADSGAAHALRTTYSNAANLMNEAPSPGVNPDTEVWIVTLYPAPGHSFVFMPDRPGPPTSYADSAYSVIMDAVNGGVIDDCTGCAAITSG